MGGIALDLFIGVISAGPRCSESISTDSNGETTADGATIESEILALTNMSEDFDIGTPSAFSLG